MKSMRLLRSSVIQTLILAFLTVCAPLLWAQGPPQWVEGRILIQPRAGLPASEFDRINRWQCALVRRRHRLETGQQHGQYRQETHGNYSVPAAYEVLRLDEV